MLLKKILDVHPRSDSTEFHGMAEAVSIAPIVCMVMVLGFSFVV